MSSFPEKNSNLPSRLLRCLIIVSMVLLLLSFISLFQLSDNNTVFFHRTSSLKLAPSSSSITSPISIDNQKHILTENQNSHWNEKMITVKDEKQSLLKLKVYMYDLPPEFHFGLMGWKGKENQTWPKLNEIPRYPGGLNLQHSIEYWLTLDLLSKSNPDRNSLCKAIRVFDLSQADVIFVPFFSSLSYNRHSKLQGKEKVSLNKILQDKLVSFLESRIEWKQFNGKKHMIVAHHPNSMLDVRKNLGSAMFVLADFGRYPEEVANLDKDLIAPYKHLVRPIDPRLSAPFEKRPMLVYFQGAIYRKDGGEIRQELFYLLKDEKDVHFSFGSIQSNGINRAGQGMAKSKFCLNIAGDTPSSNRLFDAIASHCVPVIVSDQIELPFEDILDYSEFCIFVLASDAAKKGFLLDRLRRVKRAEWTRMWEKLKRISHHFEYQYPTVPGDAVNMIWDAVWRKKFSVVSNTHRKTRYNSSHVLAYKQHLNY
ncbi:probable arabinosyltransferase ARAD2 [Impatiens glandulifera]|uniref:probable arabinosyltransferase ARAD2 n=1 Tax=Impatiens glandulifera TaxID=253017 RepID=UPI001FB07003|nr:probable arabinosyltransferase ARAD2 [Impatiens glandulifera]